MWDAARYEQIAERLDHVGCLQLPIDTYNRLSRVNSSMMHSIRNAFPSWVCVCGRQSFAEPVELPASYQRLEWAFALQCESILRAQTSSEIMQMTFFEGSPML